MANANRLFSEDKTVQRNDRVPVGQSQKTARLEPGGLLETTAVRVTADRLHLELEPSYSWELHLRVEVDTSRHLAFDDAPEVHGFAVRELLGMTPATTQAWAARDPVHPAS